MLKHRQGAQYSNGQPWPDPTAKEEGLFDKQQPGGFLHLFANLSYSFIVCPSLKFFHCLPNFPIVSSFAHLSNWFPGRDILSAAKLEQRSSSFFVSSSLSTSSDQRALQVHQPHHCRQDEHWSLIMSKKRLVIKQMETCMKMKHDENCGNQLVVTVFNQRSIGASTLTLAQVSIKMTPFTAPGALTVECLQNCGSQKRFTGLPSLRSPPKKLLI